VQALGDCARSSSSSTATTETRCAHCFVTFATGAELMTHKALHCFPGDPGQVAARFPAGAQVYDSVAKQPAVVVGTAANASKAHACVSVQSANGVVADVAISRLERTDAAKEERDGSTAISRLERTDAAKEERDGSTFRNATVDASLMRRLPRKLLACKSGNCFLKYAQRNGAEKVKGNHVCIRFGGKTRSITGPSSMKKEMGLPLRKQQMKQLIELGIVKLSDLEE